MKFLTYRRLSFYEWESWKLHFKTWGNQEVGQFLSYYFIHFPHRKNCPCFRISPGKKCIFFSKMRFLFQTIASENSKFENFQEKLYKLLFEAHKLKLNKPGDASVNARDHLVVLIFGRLHFWSSSLLVVFVFGRLCFWSSSFWSSSFLVVWNLWHRNEQMNELNQYNFVQTDNATLSEEFFR